jgi:hypothetical protein
MDQATLVRDQIDGGEKLLTRLRESGFDMTAACWAKTEDDGQWYLYIVSPSVEVNGVRPGYAQIRSTLNQMDSEWTHPLERVEPVTVKLIGSKDPLAQGVLEMYRRFPGPIPTWHGGSVLGSVYVDGAYVYPPTMFAPAQPQAG